MNTKKTVANKKQTVSVKDLKTRKNPKGGAIKPKAGGSSVPAGEVQDCRPNVY